MNFAKLFGKKNKNSSNFVTIKAQVNIQSKVNEIFATTKVTQKLTNNSNNPIELEIYINKYLDKVLFSSFHAKIGNSMEASSKVIKAEKAEEKYTDSISSGNAAIYTTIDKYDKNKIIVHIGNIPSKEELIFTSEFIQFTESSNNSFECELFRNLPILKGIQGVDIDNEKISGSLEIKTTTKINKIEKQFLSKELIIKAEKNEESKKLFSLEYEYEDCFSSYIPTNKIYFSLDSNVNAPILFSQNCSKNKDEQSYILNYKLTEKSKKGEQEYIKLNPALFIFLLDQSGSMAGSPIKVASKALILFLQSLPAGSYYQIIGFGSNYRVYDNDPKEYNQKNIMESIKMIEKLKGDLGGTDIYDPLKYIYRSSQKYNKILLPRIIFLLTDGEIENKNDTLKIIEKNSNEYSIYSFGIGNDFDADLIKNAGIIGKGNYSFCRKIDGLNQVIASTLNNICVSYIKDFKITSSLDNINLYKTNEEFKILKENKFYRFNYITKGKLDLKKVNFAVEYKQNGEKISKKYELELNELPIGDELSKLILYDYISKTDNLSEEEKIKLALKYQLLIKGTSLFAELELSEKNTEKIVQCREIKTETREHSKDNNNQYEQLEQKISDLEKGIINYESKINNIRDEIKEKIKSGNNAGAKILAKKQAVLIERIKQMEGNMAMMEEQKMMLDHTLAMKDVMSEIKSCGCAMKCASKGMEIEELSLMKDDMEDIKADEEELKEFFNDYDNDEDDKVNDILEQCKEEISQEGTGNPKVNEDKLEQKNDNEQVKNDEDFLNQFLCDEVPKQIQKKEEKKEEKKEIKKEEKKEEKELKIDLKEKESVMEIINCQNFVEGFWDINNKTQVVKRKYEKEFKSLKDLKNKKIDDIVAMTIIIIYFLNKEHKELLEELIMILKKAKLYIQGKIGDSYENIIKKAGIN